MTRLTTAVSFVLQIYTRFTFELGFRILDSFAVEYLLLSKKFRQFIDVHSINKSIVGRTTQARFTFHHEIQEVLLETLPYTEKGLCATFKELITMTPHRIGLSRLKELRMEVINDISDLASYIPVSNKK
jgi:hypothetical protein